MTDKLKPCPFCGGELVEMYGYYTHSNEDVENCFVGTVAFRTYDEEMIELWNTRKPMDRIVEQLEEVSFVETVEEYAEINLLLLEDAIEIVKAGGK